MDYILPMFCDSCGNAFPSGVAIDSATRVTNLSFSNYTAECPRCGGIGRIPDGVYNFIDGTLTVLHAPERSIKELKRLAEILKAARADPHKAADLEQKIQTEVPAFAQLLDKWKPKTAGDRYALIGILLAAVGLVIAMRESSKPTTTVTVHQVIANTYVQAPAAAPKAHSKKVGRNEPCPCGSGKKYKRCCGNLADAPTPQK
jgi:hypothetical protein